MRPAFPACVLAGILAFAGAAHGHEARPCYFELRQTGPERYDLTWKVPMRGDLRLGIYPRLPEGCVATKPPVTYVAQGALIERQTVTCPGGQDDPSM